MKRLGILGSGKGSNFAAIADAVQRQTLPVEIAIVLSDVENSGILALAKKHGVPHRFVAPGKFRTKLEPDVEMEYLKILQEVRVDLVALAGFMRILKPAS